MDVEEGEEPAVEAAAVEAAACDEPESSSGMLAADRGSCRDGTREDVRDAAASADAAPAPVAPGAVVVTGEAAAEMESVVGLRFSESGSGERVPPRPSPLEP